MSSKRVWQGNWDGRESTIWTGSIRSLRKKIPTFTQNAFRMAKGINKYRDLIVREPIMVVVVKMKPNLCQSGGKRMKIKKLSFILDISFLCFWVWR